MIPRFFIPVLLATPIGLWLNHTWGVNASDPIMLDIGYKHPVAWLTLWWTWTALLYTTPYFVLAFVMSSGMAMRLRLPKFRTRAGQLPKVTPIAERKELYAVIGELHHQTRLEPSEHPAWLTIPERGLYTGIIALGATGGGKTTSVVRPLAEQLLGYAAKDAKRKCSALVLEVKGDFCHQVRELLTAHGRGGDYLSLSLNGEYRFNPLMSDRSAYETAHSIAALMGQIHGGGGKGKGDDFWPQAYTHTLANTILFFKTTQDYVTMHDIYHACCHPQWLFTLFVTTEKAFASAKWIVIEKAAYFKVPAGIIDELAWEDEPNAKNMMRLEWSEPVETLLDQKDIPYNVAEVDHKYGTDRQRRHQMRVFQQWYRDEWMVMDAKLRTGIVAGIAPFLQVFHADSRLGYIFCPPKEAYDPDKNEMGFYGKVLPPIRDIIEDGKVLALDFPVAENPAVARLIGTLLKLEYQRAMLMRIPQMSAEPWRTWRPSLFLCDEYQEFATVGGSSPGGDERFFAQSRGARCIPIVATQSVSSLRSVLHDESAVNTLLQGFRTTLIMATSDEYTAQWASKRCGREDRIKASLSLQESGSKSRVSLLTGDPVSEQSGLGMGKAYSLMKDFVFEPKVFMELPNSVCIALPYDGVSPLPASLCCTRPSRWTDNDTWFEHAKRGDL